MLSAAARVAPVLAALSLLLPASGSAMPIGAGGPAPDAWLSYGGDDELTNDVDGGLPS